MTAKPGRSSEGLGCMIISFTPAVKIVTRAKAITSSKTGRIFLFLRPNTPTTAIIISQKIDEPPIEVIAAAEYTIPFVDRPFKVWKNTLSKWDSRPDACTVVRSRNATRFPIIDIFRGILNYALISSNFAINKLNRHRRNPFFD
jgi:hypothetical protein